MENFKIEPRTAQDILEQLIWINNDVITINNILEIMEKCWNFIYKSNYKQNKWSLLDK